VQQLVGGVTVTPYEDPPPNSPLQKQGGNHIVMHRIKHVVNSYVPENGRM